MFALEHLAKLESNQFNNGHTSITDTTGIQIKQFNNHKNRPANHSGKHIESLKNTQSV